MDLQIASSHRPLDDVGLAAKYILIQRAEMDGLMAGYLYVQQGLRLRPEDDWRGRLTCVELCENRAEQSRAEQNRTEQIRTEQSRTEQRRTEQNRTEQNRTELNRAEQSRTEQN